MANFNLTTDLIQSIPMLECLSAEHKDELIKAASVITVAKHKRIYQYNDAIQHVFIVMKGSIKLAAQTEGNKVLVKYIAYKNEILEKTSLRPLLTALNLPKPSPIAWC